MSVIQKIRDKYARIAVIAIALALLGFILMDAFAGRSSLFGGRDTTIGKINGKKVEADAFTRRVNEISKRQGQNGENQTPQIVESLWQQEIRDQVMGEQYEKLGLTITDKELESMLFGPNPPQEFKQYFGDPNNPQNWDPNTARQNYKQVEKSGTLEQKAFLKELTDYIKSQALMNKYTALLANSTYIPKWFLDKRAADNNLMAKASYVAVPYTSIADSTVKVSDADITAYANEHKKDYELKEETRSVSYVQFSAAPSSKDSAGVRDQVVAIKDSFQRIPDMKEFVRRGGIGFQYNDGWFAAKDIPFQNKDSMLKAPVGTVTGPYVENGQYMLVRVLDRKTQPDTVKLRHILLGLNTQQGTPLRDTVAAKRIADSVQNAVAAGSNFDSLALKLSDDPGSKFRGGVYDSITRQSGFVPEFADFIFNKPTGSKGVVKTQFGYHYIEVLNQRGSSEVYKVALYAKPIEPSPETESKASEAANMFAANAKDEKSFKEYFDKNLKGKNIASSDAPSVATLRPMDFGLPTIQGSARELVKKIFDAKKGQVLDPYTVGSNTIVAVVTDVSEPGIPSATALRSQIEPLLLNKKKADKIKEQMGKVADLNAVATKFNQQVQTADSIAFVGGGQLGFETKVVGALFNPDNKGKTVADPIAGNTGVYAIRVENTFANASAEKPNTDQMRQMMEMQGRQQINGQQLLETLKKRAEIKDYRAKFY